MQEHQHFENTSVKYADMVIKTLRVRIEDVPGNLGKVATAIGKSGALLGDICTHHVDSHFLTRDITVFVQSEKMLEKAIANIHHIKNVSVIKIIDEVLNMHRDGKIAITSTIPLDNLADLRKAYTPGVASVSELIYRHPEKFYDYTYVGNTICIVTNGTAVLGLGNIGVKAAMPVMEGKAVLLKKFSDVNAVPILIDSEDPDVIVNAVLAIAPSFGAIQLEDIKAPECFEIERRLIEKLDKPVFHDDQHGTAVVTLAAMMNALKLLKKDRKKIKVVINGAGAAGMAICRLLMGWGIKNIVLCDTDGAIYNGREKNMNSAKEEIALLTNLKSEKGSLKNIIKGKDIFIGVSGPNLVTPAMIKSMNKKAVCFALANPIPEIFPKDAIKAGAVLALDGRSLNNALAFPGIFKGALKARAKAITLEMKIAAAKAIAKEAKKGELVPNQLDPKVHHAVTKAVFEAV
ncbi:MAG: hypothetical protein A2452_09350 [Candidatus Firestonebacteria bacterium RIFOXYC2_FULL_39_67]|nr:MAG: hypothetical protein A2536_07230 [Candidatus Firestonebacteria bacterium RIFOXYD2_FULL_39_29]OGF54608.1 MAG: hypothetical protein A2452_09350 [Candidatus Firestonebacteria bacterium RIFOXYC2_FULL_39_67]